MKVNKKSSSTTFKYNNIDDSKIYDALENKVIDKSQFIKNALYYYIIMIERNSVIDRNLPLETNTNMNDISKLLELINQKQNIDRVEEEANKTVNNEELQVPEELLGVNEDDFDF